MEADQHYHNYLGEEPPLGIIDLGIVLAGGLRYGRDPLRGYAQDKEMAWIATGFTLIVAYSLQVDEMVTTLLIGLF